MSKKRLVFLLLHLVITVVITGIYPLYLEIFIENEENHLEFTDIGSSTLKKSNSNTEIIVTDFIKQIKRKSQKDQEIEFYFNDLINNKPITGLNNESITVYDQDGELWGKNIGDYNWSLKTSFDWEYILYVSIKGYDAGDYRLRIDVSKEPTYDLSSAYISFKIIGNVVDLTLKSVKNEGLESIITEDNDIYDNFLGSSTYIEFEVFDRDVSNLRVEDYYNQSNLFVVYRKTEFSNLSLTIENGTITANINYIQESRSFGGFFDSSNLSLGEYEITFTFSMLNYKNASYYLKLRIIERLTPVISMIPLGDLIVGETTTITLVVRNQNNDQSIPITNSYITVVLYINEGIVVINQIYKTNNDGVIGIEFIVPINAESMYLYAEMGESYKHINATRQEFNIRVLSLAGTIFVYTFIIFSIIGFIVSCFALYHYKILPYKKYQKKFLSEFEKELKDVYNIDHIIAINRHDNNLILLKSLKIDQIAPQSHSKLIKEILSLIKDELIPSRIFQATFYDKQLVYGHTELISIGFILNTNPSNEFSEKFKQLLSIINNQSEEILITDNRENLEVKVSDIIEDIFKISLIQVFCVNNDHTPPKTRYVRESLKEINMLNEKSSRYFFTLPSIIIEIKSNTRNDIYKIIKSVQDLVNQKILIPLLESDIYNLPYITQNRDLIEYYVSELDYLKENEKTIIKQEIIKYVISKSNKELFEQTILNYKEDHKN